MPCDIVRYDFVRWPWLRSLLWFPLLFMLRNKAKPITVQHKFIILLNSGKSTLCFLDFPTPVDIPGIRTGVTGVDPSKTVTPVRAFDRFRALCHVGLRVQTHCSLIPLSPSTSCNKSAFAVFVLYLSHTCTSIHCHKNRAEAKKCV